MGAGKYLIRAAKYLVKLIILLAVLFALMLYSNTTTLSAENFFADFFNQPRGWLLIGIVILWSLLYPKVEFVRRHVEGNLREDRKGIINALNAGGMTLSGKSEGSLEFRAESPMRRIWWLWEDAVTVTQDGGKEDLIIAGPRRFVSEAQSRLPGYIEAGRNADGGLNEK